MSRVDEALRRARCTLRRLSPREAASAAQSASLLVDIRPSEQRAHFGEVPGALVLERNVLEWRLDPTSASRHPGINQMTKVIVFCQEGYASSLAAAGLRDIGIDATDLVGGFAAWQQSGLPTTGP